MNENLPQVGEEIPLTIRRIGINGEGIGYFKKIVVFVKGALTNEEIVAKVSLVKSNYMEASIKKIRKKSPYRVTPPCPVYEACGGCQLQHLDYERQLVLKKDLLYQALEKHTSFKVDKLKIRDTIGVENPFRYRNKSQFQVRMDKKGDVVTGLYRENSHDIVATLDCLVQKPSTVAITNQVRQIVERLEISVYNERKNTGFLRTIVVRTGLKTNEKQLVLVTSKADFPQKEPFIKMVCAACPDIVSIMQNVNQNRTSLVFGDETKLLYGKKTIVEKLNEISFHLSARAFFQLNPSQTVKLYDEVKKALLLKGKEKIVDLYCGVGTIGLSFAKEALEVRGMDIIPEAIEDAKKNAALNNLTNTHFEAGDAKAVFAKWLKEGFKPDAVIVDPPRKGLDDALIRTLLSTKPEQIVYVSCNPSTLARDLEKLSKRYRIRYLQPVDMFPMTSHVECVVRLQKRKY